MRKKVSVLLVCLLLLSLSQVVLAAGETDQIIKTESTSKTFILCSATISTSSKNIVCKTKSVLKETAPQSITMYLQKKNGNSWTTVAQWRKSTTDDNLVFSKTYSKSPGTYRVKGKHTAHRESEYSYSSSKTVSK